VKDLKDRDKLDETQTYRIVKLGRDGARGKVLGMFHVRDQSQFVWLQTSKSARETS